MIGHLHGVFSGMRDQSIIIDVHGVGYLVEVSSRLLSQLPSHGEVMSLAIETHVREDQFRLFGFMDETERQWFKLLMSVQGVGAKVALAVLGVLSPSELNQSIATQDKAMIARTPGVGPKVAQRIVQELKDKAPEGVFVVSDHTASASRELEDALSALTNLGYPQATAFSVLQRLRQADPDGGVQDLIKGALREMSQ